MTCTSLSLFSYICLNCYDMHIPPLILLYLLWHVWPLSISFFVSKITISWSSPFPYLLHYVFTHFHELNWLLFLSFFSFLLFLCSPLLCYLLLLCILIMQILGNMLLFLHKSCSTSYSTRSYYQYNGAWWVYALSWSHLFKSERLICGRLVDHR